MDLFLSSQSVGLVAVVAAGCMVAAGAASNRWSRWRSDRKRREVPGTPSSDGAGEPRDTLPASGRHHVAIAGRLRIEGSACARLQDAALAAASTFYLCHQDGTHAWGVRARKLFLEVQGERVRLEGPMLVDIGSEEQFPGATLGELRGRVMDRVCEATLVELPTRADVPRYGVFRSLCDGDEVVVTGWLDRGGDGTGPASYRRRGGGSCLRPVDDGALVASFRRRPTVRGPLGTVKMWAAAFVGAAVTTMVMGLLAAAQPNCAEGELDCILYGGCGPKLQLDRAGVYAACVPTRRHDCRQSLACQLSGRCDLGEGGCAATRPHHCERSLACERYGRCSVDDDGACVGPRGAPEGWMGSRPSRSTSLPARD